MTNVLALIPARSGSKGIPHKNFRELAGGPSPVQRAMLCAEEAGCDPIVVSTDLAPSEVFDGGRHRRVRRPPALAQDDTPMIDVVRHALAEIPGPEDQIILLVQPTQPLRQPKHLTTALEALTSDWDSVVTITRIPRGHAPQFVLGFCGTTLSASPYVDGNWVSYPARRQAVPQPYVLDGTAYVFRRRTVTAHGNIYGEFVRGLIIPADETCPLDTLEDWHDAERRLRERPPQA